MVPQLSSSSNILSQGGVKESSRKCQEKEPRVGFLEERVHRRVEEKDGIKRTVIHVAQCSTHTRIKEDVFSRSKQLNVHYQRGLKDTLVVQKDQNMYGEKKQ